MTKSSVSSFTPMFATWTLKPCGKGVMAPFTLALPAVTLLALTSVVLSEPLGRCRARTSVASSEILPVAAPSVVDGPIGLCV